MKKREPQFKDFGERFKKALQEKGLIKQTDVARRLTIGNGHLSDLLGGYKFPSDLLFSVIEERLGISSDWLAKGEGEMFIKKSTFEELMSVLRKMDEEYQKETLQHARKELRFKELLRERTAQTSKKTILKKGRRRAVQ